MQFPVNLLLAGIIVVVAWILNLSAICAMRALNSGSRVVYGFLSSLCVANLFLATLDFPPSIISKILVSRSLKHVFCVSWTYLDTLLCNVMILHLLGCSLDSYLRLRHSLRYASSTKQLMTCLKLSAPWTISFIQSTAFMAITQTSASSFEEGVCVISDPNFLILRSVMCFGVPISASAILVFLSAKRLSHIERISSTSASTTVNKPTPNSTIKSPNFKESESYQLLSPRSPNIIGGINRDETQETITSAADPIPSISPNNIDVSNYVKYFQHQCPQHGLLSFPVDKTLPIFQLPSHLYDSTCRSCQSSSSDYKEASSSTIPCYGINYFCPNVSYQHCPDLIPTMPGSSNVSGTKQANLNSNLHTSISSGNISVNPSIRPVLPASQSLDLQRIQDSGTGSELEIQKEVSQRKIILNENLIKAQERITVAVNLSLCIFSILLWGPFVIGSLIQGVCKPPYCILPVSNNRINEFKWLSYILCIVHPLIFLVIDSKIRSVIKSSFTR